jgi:hypothetical protein
VTNISLVREGKKQNYSTSRWIVGYQHAKCVRVST